MSKEKIKVYLYTRVSTTMQIDGYSLDAQKTKMKAFCDYNEYEIAGEYEDAGKSGKSIEGRIAFNQMMDDIKSGKDEVSYVLVFKLSRFGRNAADVLATLQVMQDFGVNLICVEDGIDSSKDAGKTKKRALLADKITGDNIYKALIFFDKLYAQMNEAEKREFLSQLVDNVQIYEERKENGQWLKSIEFKLPIIEKEFTLSLDNDTQNETVVLLSKGIIDSQKVKVEMSLADMDMSRFKKGATYEAIKDYVKEQTGYKVSSLYIAQVKAKHGLDMRENFNLPKSEDARQPKCPAEKEKAIEDALRHFQMI